MKDCKGEHSSSRETVNVSILQELLSLEERLGNVNRGATQDIIEMNTLPYKYKKVSNRRGESGRGGKWEGDLSTLKKLLAVCFVGTGILPSCNLVFPPFFFIWRRRGKGPFITYPSFQFVF